MKKNKNHDVIGDREEVGRKHFKDRYEELWESDKDD